jgi:predicted dehydrogenase
MTSPTPANPRPIVIIGTGGIVRDAHLPAYRKAGFDTQVVYDLNRGRAAALAADYGIPHVAGSLAEAVSLAPANAVFDLALPPSEILATLDKIPDGRGVLIQKPMGENLAEAVAIRALCRRKKLTAAVNFQLRYAPYVIAARHLIESGAIGELHDMEARVTVETSWRSWPFFEKLHRVEMIFHSLHYLDVVRAFLGNPKGVYAKTVKHPHMLNLASTRSSIILDYGEILRANIQTNHGHAYGPEHQESYLKWEGTKGAIKARMGLLMDYPKGVPDRLQVCMIEDGRPATWTDILLQGRWFPDAFIGTMSSVMIALDDPARPAPTSVEDAFQTMALVEAAYQSSASGATPIPHI